MKARIAKKILRDILRREIEMLHIPPGGALLMKYDPRHYPHEGLLSVAMSWQDAIGAPVLLCPKSIDISVGATEPKTAEEIVRAAAASRPES